MSQPSSMIATPCLTLLRSLFVAGAVACIAQSAFAASFSEIFDGPTLLDWQAISRTENPSGINWRLVSAIVDESEAHLIDPHGGTAMGTVGFEAVASGAGTISEWLISPTIYGLNNGDTIAFYTRTIAGSPFPDRLEVRLSSAAASADVGSTASSVGVFTNLLTSVNPSLTSGGYPEDWTLVTATVSGLSGPTTGRFALRYFVTDGGPGGTNSNRVVVDDLAYSANTPDSFKITSITLQPTKEMTLEFQSEPGRVYRLDYTTDLLATWTPLVDEVVSQGAISRAGDAGRIDADPVIEVGMRHDAKRFYRFIDLGPTRTPAPSVSVSGVTADETYSGQLTVTVTSSVGGSGEIGTVRLFVDGIQVADKISSGASVSLPINTSEFGNGPHWIHATATAEESIAPDFNDPDGPDLRPWAGSSSPVRVSFDNFVSEWSFDPVIFQPTGANSRKITARLGASTSWELEIYDIYGEEVVRTFSGTGSQISVSWDGKDEGGSVVPWGFYKHRITFPGSFGAMSAKMVSISSTTPEPPPDAPVKITANVGNSGFSVGAMYVMDFPKEPRPPIAMSTLTTLGPAQSDAELFISKMTGFGYKKKFLIKNPRLADMLGQTWGGNGKMKTATFSYVISHGSYNGSSSSFYPLPSGSMVLVGNGLYHYHPADDLTDFPIQAMQIGDTTYPNSNCRWLIVAGCSIFSDEVVEPTLSGPQATTYPLLGEIGHGVLGFSTTAVINSRLASTWAQEAHTFVLNSTTESYELPSIISSWWNAGIESQRNAPALTEGPVYMRVICRRAYLNEKAPLLLGDVDPEGFSGELVSRSRQVAPYDPESPSPVLTP